MRRLGGASFKTKPRHAGPAALVSESRHNVFHDVTGWRGARMLARPEQNRGARMLARPRAKKALAKKRIAPPRAKRNVIVQWRTRESTARSEEGGSSVSQPSRGTELEDEGSCGVLTPQTSCRPGDLLKDRQTRLYSTSRCQARALPPAESKRENRRSVSSQG